MVEVKLVSGGVVYPVEVYESPREALDDVLENLWLEHPKMGEVFYCLNEAGNVEWAAARRGFPSHASVLWVGPRVVEGYEVHMSKGRRPKADVRRTL